MDSAYAIIDAENRAINFVVWDGVTPFDYGQDVGNNIVLLPEGEPYDYGWIWDGTKFINPNPPPPEA